LNHVQRIAVNWRTLFSTVSRIQKIFYA
jgi:hypothetical protein